jgi:hypothetical protein
VLLESATRVAVHVDETGCDDKAGHVDHLIPGCGLECGSDLQDLVAADPDRRRTAGGARPVDHRAVDEQETPLSLWLRQDCAGDSGENQELDVSHGRSFSGARNGGLDSLAATAELLCQFAAKRHLDHGDRHQWPPES